MMITSAAIQMANSVQGIAPIVVAAGIAAGAGLAESAFDFFGARESRDLQREVLDERRGRLKKLQRFQAGQFTPQERKGIEAGSASQFESVASSLSARGIGQSPVAGQLISETKQRPFLELQRAAVGAEGAELSAFESTASQNLGLALGRRAGFFNNIQGISRALVMLNGQDRTGDAEIDDAMDFFNKIGVDAVPQGQGFGGEVTV